MKGWREKRSNVSVCVCVYAKTFYKHVYLEMDRMPQENDRMKTHMCADGPPLDEQKYIYYTVSPTRCRFYTIAINTIQKLVGNIIIMNLYSRLRDRV